ncbi:low molecular weight phosphatase family protein [Aureivirga sp. CE67]|uniref:arsenate-mycothiol transferase ArsC n=1 Tax=Aureivirga sp. CE67 TaxID=1788983 RepID=UPI001E5E0E1C|nr:protein-tyrosine-phosphatase [Aureivirga sp. CE67]
MKTNMNVEIKNLIDSLNTSEVPNERKEILQPLVEYIQEKKDKNETIRLNFICTHNSRRSHLSQIWAQAISFYYEIKNVYSYSGGTEATALFPKVAETLQKNGFEMMYLSEGENPIYAFKYAQNEAPIIGFSKEYFSEFNPKSNFAAIMTCSQADGGCPFIAGAEKRVPITYEDPKLFDGTEQQDEKYLERSLEIATELKFVFSQIK